MYKMIVKSVAVAVVGGVVLSAVSGCDGNSTAPKAKKILSSSEIKDGAKPLPNEKKRASEVSVGDVADYATGVTPLKTKKSVEKRLQDIYSTHNQEQEKALQEQ